MSEHFFWLSDDQVDRLKPCPAYKPSGVEWLGHVPAHWEVRRLKALVTNVVDQTTQRPEHEITLALENVESWSGRYADAGPGMALESQLKRFQAGDVLFGKLRPYLAKVTCPDKPGVCVGEFLVLRPRNENVSPGFLQRVLCSKPVIDAVNASTFGAKMPRAEWQFIGNMEQPLPPFPEQAAIVRYLDHADARIRRYISAKERLIGLLEEQRQAVIHRAVTRGLNPNVRLKTSGVEWLGDVPRHWKIRRLRNVVNMRVSNVDKHVKDDEISVRLCNYVDVYKNDYVSGRMDFMRATATNEEIERFRLEKDDVLITKDSETWDDIGVPALVTEPAADLVSGYHLALLRPRPDKLAGTYLLRALQSKGLAYQFHVEAKGVTRYGLSHAGIKSARLPLPPLPEQTAIVAYLDKATADIDTAIARARRQIELLREYRTRLIADVVTGKLAVREENAHRES